jgi:hypothetical protein
MEKNIEMINVFEYQKKHIGWTFYNEREFIENEFHTRFNFLIATYALFINAIFLTEANDSNSKMVLLIIGLLVFTVMCATVNGVYRRLKVLLKILYLLEENHVFPIVDRELKKNVLIRFLRVNNLFRSNELMGIYMPLLIISSFILGIILLHFGIWTAPSLSQ